MCTLGRIEELDGILCIGISFLNRSLIHWANTILSLIGTLYSKFLRQEPWIAFLTFSILVSGSVWIDEYIDMTILLNQYNSTIQHLLNWLSFSVFVWLFITAIDSNSIYIPRCAKSTLSSITFCNSFLQSKSYANIKARLVSDSFAEQNTNL